MDAREREQLSRSSEPAGRRLKAVTRPGDGAGSGEPVVGNAANSALLAGLVLLCLAPEPLKQTSWFLGS